MAERIVELVILAEDLRAANLFRRYAQHFVEKRRIRIERCPRGSGEQYVRENFPKWVQWMRANKSRRRTALLVHVDADKGSVSGELRLLGAALKNATMEQRKDDERIAIAVPKRNVETWIHGLSGVEVDEEYDYKRDPDSKISSVTPKRELLTDKRIRHAAEALYVLTRNNASDPPISMPSLQAAIPELRRLEKPA